MKPPTVGALAASLFAFACGTELLPGAPDAAPPADAEPAPDAEPAFAIDLFGAPGHTFRFDISADQGAAMEQRNQGGGNGDPYDLGGGTGTFANDVLVTDVADGQQQRLGKLEVWLIGESSFRPWNGIPNIRVDADEYQPGHTVGGTENIRFNNGQVGGIYREAIALRLWSALGYPTPRTSFAWVEAPTQWGASTRVPMTLVEVYKSSWCDWAVPGGCPNMWEGVGEPHGFYSADPCQIDECDDTRLIELGNAIASAPRGVGYADALASIIDWDMFHSFQCLSWITGTGDDYIHNNNNLLVVERADGKLQFHPYSVDISASQDWYPNTPLLGTSELARGCQTDPACWQDTLTTCAALLDAYDELDVVTTVVQPVVDAIAEQGMERGGDDDRAEHVLGWYTSRADKLRTDPIWDQVPCVSDEACATLGDERTACRDVCVEPRVACDFSGNGPECAEGYFCTYWPWNECQAYEP